MLTCCCGEQHVGCVLRREPDAADAGVIHRLDVEPVAELAEVAVGHRDIGTGTVQRNPPAVLWRHSRTEVWWGRGAAPNRPERKVAEYQVMLSPEADEGHDVVAGVVVDELSQVGETPQEGDDVYTIGKPLLPDQLSPIPGCSVP